MAKYGLLWISRLDTYSQSSTRDIHGDTIKNLFETRALLENVELQITRWHLKQDDPEFRQKYESVTSILKELLNVKEITIDRRKDQVFYEEQDNEGKIYQPLRFHQLASGYRSIISMVGDMILRLFETQPDVHNPSDLVGIVIIDELDLYFHPKLQKYDDTELEKDLKAYLEKKKQ